MWRWLFKKRTTADGLSSGQRDAATSDAVPRGAGASSPTVVLYARVGDETVVDENRSPTVDATASSPAVKTPLKIVQKSRSQRRRRAERLAKRFQAMPLQHADLLRRVHRRTVGQIAGERPALLHRDLRRYSHSSEGQRVLRGREIPSLRVIHRYVENAKHVSRRANTAVL